MACSKCIYPAARDADAEAEASHALAVELGLVVHLSATQEALLRCLRVLSLDSKIDLDLKDIQLPTQLLSLSLPDTYVKPLNGVTLPPTLKALRLSPLYQHHVDFPPSLEHASYGTSTCVAARLVKLTYPLPASSLELYCGFYFNQKLDSLELPPSLEMLQLGKCYNRSLKGVVLPKTLQILRLGCMYNRSLTGVTFPAGLRVLDCGASFRRSLRLDFPAEVELVLAASYRRTLLHIDDDDAAPFVRRVL